MSSPKVYVEMKPEVYKALDQLAGPDNTWFLERVQGSLEPHYPFCETCRRLSCTTHLYYHGTVDRADIEQLARYTKDNDKVGRWAQRVLKMIWEMDDEEMSDEIEVPLGMLEEEDA